jgi:hypothetical protein
MYPSIPSKLPDTQKSVYTSLYHTTLFPLFPYSIKKRENAIIFFPHKKEKPASHPTLATAGFG